MVDHVGLVGHALGGVGGEHSCHIDRVRRCGAQHVGQLRPESDRGLGKTSTHGHIARCLRPHVLVELRVDRVDGVLRGLDQIDLAAVAAVKVVDLPPVDLHRGR